MNIDICLSASELLAQKFAAGFSCRLYSEVKLSYRFTHGENDEAILCELFVDISPCPWNPTDAHWVQFDVDGCGIEVEVDAGGASLLPVHEDEKQNFKQVIEKIDWDDFQRNCSIQYCSIQYV
ncbi:hypothetical protein FBZ84_14012 [Azospirillum baldaniorum]|uniref:hypothetical protein n=1 Tax=Azospirillum baldaniorum TaxID=1064539 RepID=UPI0011A9FBCE|nr:hypothetical protein [Azospirillum baldaniorum]TWA52117.1 hypothetical protein FBZ84_14012 [Azospirillum baldaniorum]